MSDQHDDHDDDEPEIDPKVKAWIEKIFTSAAAEAGGVVRREKSSVLKHASLDELRDFIYDSSFHLLETADQFIIVCNTEPVILHC